MSRVALCLAATLTLGSIASGPAAALYSERVCQELGQSFEQIERGALVEHRVEVVRFEAAHPVREHGVLRNVLGEIVHPAVRAPPAPGGL